MERDRKKFRDGCNMITGLVNTLKRRVCPSRNSQRERGITQRILVTRQLPKHITITLRWIVSRMVCRVNRFSLQRSRWDSQDQKGIVTSREAGVECGDTQGKPGGGCRRSDGESVRRESSAWQKGVAQSVNAYKVSSQRLAIHLVGSRPCHRNRTSFVLICSSVGTA